MSNNSDKNEESTKLLKTIINREILEDRALAALTSETLQKLNITLDRLPRKSQALLEQVSKYQTDLQLQELDPILMSLYKSRVISEKLDDEYEILKLKQKNIELQVKIDRNNRFLAQLRKDLEDSKTNLLNQNPNPDNIQEHMRQLKQKLTAYEDSYESMLLNTSLAESQRQRAQHNFCTIEQKWSKLKTSAEHCYQCSNKYTSLNIPEGILPKTIKADLDLLQTLSEEAVKLKAQADDVIFMRETKAMLTKLRK